SSLLAVSIGIVFLFGFFWETDARKHLFDRAKKMTGANFVMLLFIFMSSQIFATVFGTGVEWGLNQFGYSVLNDIKSASSTSETISMLLYSAIAAPVTEELIFRGFVMRGLEKIGKWYAIIISAFLFGAFHGNFVQGAYAFIAALALGYIAMEYSIYWSILLHVMNNFVFGDLFSYLTDGLSDQTQTVLSYSMEGIFLVGTLIVLIIKRKKLAQSLRELHMTKEKWIGTVTAAALIIFLLIQFYFGMSGVEPLKLEG
ncbi:MAG: CPBP family intramembrane metalloprotease, partial [Clostridia bacterium]|nr:CPBP family intramembrane metalloprotease [Clostridia bacterium]